MMIHHLRAPLQRHNCLVVAPLSVLSVLFLLLGLGTITSFHVEAFAARQFHVLSHSPCPSALFRQQQERHSRVYRITPATTRQLSNDNEEYDPREKLGREIRGFGSSALKTTIDVGDTVVCKRTLPNLGIYDSSSYEVKSIYTQYFDDETQQIVKEPLSTLDGDVRATLPNPVYMTLFSPQHHTEAVVVTPEEVGLISVREELGNAAWLAVPGFFWVILATSFFNIYHERTGGSIGDAFLGR